MPKRVGCDVTEFVGDIGRQDGLEVELGIAAAMRISLHVDEQLECAAFGAVEGTGRFRATKSHEVLRGQCDARLNEAVLAGADGERSDRRRSPGVTFKIDYVHYVEACD